VEGESWTGDPGCIPAGSVLQTQHHDFLTVPLHLLADTRINGSQLPSPIPALQFHHSDSIILHPSIRLVVR